MSEEQRSAGEAARQYAEELKRWREGRGLSKRGLALLMSYDRSYVSQIEGCHLPPTEDFTRRAEAVMTAGDALWARWEEYEAAKRRAGLGGSRTRSERPLSAVTPLSGELFAEHDDAALTYDGDRYRLKMSRHLHNEGGGRRHPLPHQGVGRSVSGRAGTLQPALSPGPADRPGARARGLVR